MLHETSASWATFASHWRPKIWLGAIIIIIIIKSERHDNIIA